MWLMFVGVLRNSLRKQELMHSTAHAIFELVIFFERNTKMIIIITKIINGGLSLFVTKVDLGHEIAQKRLQIVHHCYFRLFSKYKQNVTGMND